MKESEIKHDAEVVFMRNFTILAALLLLVIPFEAGELIGTWTGKSAEEGYGETYVFTFRSDGILEMEETPSGKNGKTHKDTAEYEVDGNIIRVTFLTGFFAGTEGLSYFYTLEGDRLTLTANGESANAETVIFERKQPEDIR
jgi:hypothetical protein